MLKRNELKREVEQVIVGHSERLVLGVILVLSTLAVVAVSVYSGMVIGRHRGWKDGWNARQATAHSMVECVDGSLTRVNGRIKCTPHSYISPRDFGTSNRVSGQIDSAGFAVGFGTSNRQVRSLSIKDGVSGQIALFDGASHTSTFHGDVVVKGRLIVEKHGPLSGRVVFDSVQPAPPTCVLAVTSVTGFEYHCFSH